MRYNACFAFVGEYKTICSLYFVSGTLRKGTVPRTVCWKTARSCSDPSVMTSLLVVDADKPGSIFGVRGINSGAKRANAR